MSSTMTLPLELLYTIGECVHDAKTQLALERVHPVFEHQYKDVLLPPIYVRDKETFDKLVHNIVDGKLRARKLNVMVSSDIGVTDVSALGGVHTLDLAGCRGVTDVSALGGVHTLNLAYCKGVTDVSALGGVHTLNLSNCYNVTDVSALGGVHTLNLSDCSGVTDVSALGGVHTLNLMYCYGVTDVSALGGVHTLNLSGCDGVRENDIILLMAKGVHVIV